MEDWDTSSWDVIEVSHTAKVRAYNKGLAVAANITEDGSVIDENDPKWSTSLRYSSREIANYAITSSIGPSNDFARHTMTPLSGQAAQAMAEPEIQPLLTSCTVIVAAAHADMFGFCDSAHRNSQFNNNINDGYIRYTEIQDRVGAKLINGLPAFNMALMWCCSTIKTGPGFLQPPIPDRLGLLQKTGVAYAGFEDDVASYLKAGDRNTLQSSLQCPDPLKFHGEKVLQLLASGKPLNEAVETANLLFPPRLNKLAGDVIVLDMKILGDGYSRLVNVYLTGAEREGHPEAVNKWFYVLD